MALHGTYIMTEYTHNVLHMYMYAIGTFMHMISKSGKAHGKQQIHMQSIYKLVYENALMHIHALHHSA